MPNVNSLGRNPIPDESGCEATTETVDLIDFGLLEQLGSCTTWRGGNRYSISKTRFTVSRSDTLEPSRRRTTASHAASHAAGVNWKTAVYQQVREEMSGNELSRPIWRSENFTPVQKLFSGVPSTHSAAFPEIAPLSSGVRSPLQDHRRIARLCRCPESFVSFPQAL